MQQGFVPLLALKSGALLLALSMMALALWLAVATSGAFSGGALAGAGSLNGNGETFLRSLSAD